MRKRERYLWYGIAWTMLNGLLNVYDACVQICVWKVFLYGIFACGIFANGVFACGIFACGIFAFGVFACVIRA